MENLQYETISKEIGNAFVYFFYTHGRFLGNLNLIMIPQSKLCNFLKTDDVISLKTLYQNFNRNDCRGLVSVQFFAALNIFFGGIMELSKNAMTEHSSNLSMQGLSKTNDTILLDFTQIENLAANINSLLKIRTDFFKRKKKERKKEIGDFQRIIEDKKSCRSKTFYMC